MDQSEIKYFIEAALLAAARPLNADQLQKLFDGRSAPDKAEIREAIAALIEEYEPRGITIAEVASGYRMQVKAAMAERLEKLWEERPPRYSRALFETLALVAYRQPITRGEIEDIRGVSVSSNIVRTLMERDWVRVVGHRDVPGRPAMFGTTRTFLDYFGLKKLDDLPPLADLADWETLRVQLNLPEVEDPGELPVEASGPEAQEEAEVVAVESAMDESAANNDVGIEDSASSAEPAPVDDANDSSAEEEETDDGGATSDEGVDDSEPDAGEAVVVSEWPDPQDSEDIPTLKPEEEDDRDASAGGG
jgi:segregation and condensation protein B